VGAEAAETVTEAPAAAAPGYLARPPGFQQDAQPGSFPGVVVVHDVFGMTPDLRRQADRLATGGYLALAPDFWHGKPWPLCIRSAFRQVMSGTGPVFEQIDAAARWLAGQDGCSGKIGVVGFCMGGGFALLCAPRPGISAAAVNYGPVPKNAARLLAGACPVVASYAGKDRISRTDLPRLESTLTDLGVPCDSKVYPGATHAFMNEYEGRLGALTKVMGMRHDPDAAADAWRRILAFFGEHLQGTPEAEPMDGPAQAGPAQDGPAQDGPAPGGSA
jgi:carboxymethylenebutenolidase